MKEKSTENSENRGREYREKSRNAQINREARATLIAAVVVMVFWWVTGFGLAGLDVTILYMPLWFVVSCFGSWFLSIGLVVFLTRRVFQDFSLDDDEAEVRS
jgi:uncharacterized membrane protein YhdT